MKNLSDHRTGITWDIYLMAKFSLLIRMEIKENKSPLITLSFKTRKTSSPGFQTKSPGKKRRIIKTGNTFR
jgi:hypothetical protein